MAFQLSERAEQLLAQNNIYLQLILEIEGFDDIFGAVDVTKFARIGEDGITIGNFYWGGVVKSSKSKAYISMAGTSTRINQQVWPDKEGSAGVQNITVRMIDKSEELTGKFAPGAVVPDILGTKAIVYIAFQNGAHPEDSVRIMQGVITNSLFGAGYVELTISNGEENKRQEIFKKVEAELLNAINNSQTTIDLLTSQGLLLPGDVFSTYVRIKDEIIKYTGISGNQLTGCTRAQFGTIAASADAGEIVESYYVLEETAIELALKIMLSNKDKETFVEGVKVSKVGATDVLNPIANAIVFNGFNVKDKYGLVEGDKINLVGGPNAFSGRTILEYGTYAGGSYLVVDGAPLSIEYAPNSTAEFISQFNVLPDGLAMSPEHIDVERHLYWVELFGPSMPLYRFVLRDTMDAKDFIDKEIYWPASLYGVPRKGRASVNLTVPPLAFEKIHVLSKANVCNADQIKIERGTSRFFYNTIIYKCNESYVEDGKFLFGFVTTSEDSINRIKNVGSRPLTIESKGLRTSLNADTVVPVESKRFIRRFQFAPEQIKKIKVLYKAGFEIEIGDIVLLKGDELFISDLTRGDRRFAVRKFEVINKEWDYARGEISFTLLDTYFDTDNRVCVMGPSSRLTAASTSTELVVKRFYTNNLFKKERDKWRPFIGQKIRVRDEDLNFDAETVLIGFSASNPNGITVSPALPFTPGEDYILDMPDYTADDLKTLWKAVHGFVNPSVPIVSGIDAFNFTVSGGDIGKFYVGAPIKVRHDDWGTISPIVKVSNIAGNQITVDKTLGFTPTSSYFVEGIGFSSDNGLPYFYV